MKISELIKSNPTSFNAILSEILETSISNKAMLHAIIAEVSNGNPNTENKILSIANEKKDKELLRVIGIFASENND